ncbi:hypothetical protein CFter6_3217 [Collimonas fungivorans]|uniref:DUF4148 domain-containing protein n=1 Tax=Collimonas fungivorans TaxID=158899 RepID=A0A127PDT5_9BURK|nr:DUF4148 domain-containing protein [Collimonas fungivorans]AMO95865.1 hypothetical protein CFter6_3217 [Collimonas fungivorans]
MNIKQMSVVVVLLAAAGSVMAQSSAQSSAPAAGKTRAEVVRELEQARAAGQMSVGNAQYPKTPDGGSKGGMAAPSKPVTDESHQKIAPVYAGH